MKFLRNLSALLTAFFFFAMSSCQRDIDMYVPDNNIIGQILNPSPVQASVNGLIIDENDNAVIGATVRSGSNTTTTDSRGLFRFSNITMDKYASVVTVEIAGYFKGIRTFSATDGSANYIKIKLIPKALTGTVDASSGGTVTLPDHSIVTLPANGVVIKATGQAYSGNVNVYAASIDPTQDDISAVVPGSFQATDANDFRVILKSFGMMSVQLESQTGELLQIATGKTARLQFTIPVSLSASAAATIPLWSLNETDGLWKEEGQATKTGNYYEADVSHFSFWNCDQPFNAVYLELTVNTANGPLPNAIVALTSSSNGSTAYGYTDSVGHVGGMVFYNDVIELNILGNCYHSIYTQNIGPFTQNTDLGTIVVNLPAISTVQITGNAVDCNNQPVTTGNAYIYWEGQVITSPVVNGSFSTQITRCASNISTIEIAVTDNNSQQQSTTWMGNVPPSGVVDAGTLSACGITTQQYINYSINGVNYSYTAPADSLGQFQISGSVVSVFYGSNNANPSTNINIGINNPIGLGSSQSLMYLTSTFIENGASTTIQSGGTVTITEYGNIGQFISGNCNALTLLSTNGNPYTVSFSFRIRRVY